MAMATRAPYGSRARSLWHHPPVVRPDLAGIVIAGRSPILILTAARVIRRGKVDEDGRCGINDLGRAGTVAAPHGRYLLGWRPALPGAGSPAGAPAGVG